jgi:hypothetical protein
MKTHTRYAVAYIAGRRASGRTSGAVYDSQASRHINMSGTLTSSRVSAYDHDQNCHISGSGTSLYHYGNGAYVTLQLNASRFSGFDYDSQQHFTGNVNGRSVSLYDYETGRYYNYSI